jgi:plasmid stabilization system protein ParE
MKLYWHREAKQEADLAAAFYKNIQSGLEQNFLDNLEEALHRIKRHPLLYRSIAPEIRKCKIKQFPLGIIFRLKDDAIEIIAIMHIRRAPGYWTDRAHARPTNEIK